jgi:uncharacterized membrane protein YfcA
VQLSIITVASPALFAQLPAIPVSTYQLTVALALVIVGSIIQGSIGFGLAAVVAPVLLLVNKIFLPGPMLVTSMLLTFLIAWRDRKHTDWPEVAVGTSGRIIGMLPASLALRYMSGPAYELLFAAAVLAGVIISFAGWHVRLTLRNLFFTAIGSGFVSTVSAVGGPPMALVYQNETAAKIRGTLNAVFTIGTPISLVGLWWAGWFGVPELLVGVLLMPGVVVGFAISRYTAARFDDRHTKPAILALAAATAVVVVIRSVRAL